MVKKRKAAGAALEQSAASRKRPMRAAAAAAAVAIKLSSGAQLPDFDPLLDQSSERAVRQQSSSSKQSDAQMHIDEGPLQEEGVNAGEEMDCCLTGWQFGLAGLLMQESRQPKISTCTAFRHCVRSALRLDRRVAIPC
jgi:hypothetical protein